ncbi:NAD(P)-binding protein [Punctularia strigosozonata HHB-11173 SS5]|uniref:NAD(P)-binding protein n=1 Tax=Punctularia strigosozonata (strain HHB-11173) TaxID=741275 RepID=UPI000441807C|nr:NAD(P)-binding protein [Punctularia strigosozonata HHB-11173 SS5]EIN12302.1 NAD(P)-binding protein [Punctularia strigosozonata HHB-11173 SS5]
MSFQFAHSSAMPEPQISLDALYDVDGMVAVVTGGGTGIGLMMAKALEHHGATVYILGRRLDKLKAAAAEHNTHGKLLPLVCDVTSQSDLLAAVSAVQARHGHINLLINNAGIAKNLLPSNLALTPPPPPPQPATTTSPTHLAPPPPPPQQQQCAPTSGRRIQYPTPDATPDVSPTASPKTRHHDLYSDRCADSDSENRASSSSSSSAAAPSSPGGSGAPPSGNNDPAAAAIETLRTQLWSSGTQDDFQDSFAVNVTAPYYASVAFLGLLHAGNGSEWARRTGVSSQVITVSSGGGFRRDARVFSLSYTLSKAAAIHLGKLLANVLAGWGIRSNVVCPGVYPSEMTAFMTPAQVAAGCPMGRAGDLQDMAGLVLFMAGRAGAYVNGSVQLTDGGRLGMFSATY